MTGETGKGKTIAKEWTDKEDKILKKFYSKEKISELATRLGRSVNSVKRRMRILGLSKRPRYTNWTEEEDAVVRRYSEKRYRGWRADAAVYLGRSEKAISDRCLALRQMQSVNEMVGYEDENFNRKWTEADLKFVEKNRTTMSIEEMASALKRTPGSIENAIWRVHPRRGTCPVSSTLCWECRWITNPPDSPCTWAESFTPVDGWEVTYVKRAAMKDDAERMFVVIKCPLFRKG